MSLNENHKKTDQNRTKNTNTVILKKNKMCFLHTLERIEVKSKLVYFS